MLVFMSRVIEQMERECLYIYLCKWETCQPCMFAYSQVKQPDSVNSVVLAKWE